MPGGKDPGPSIKKPDSYEALKDKGFSKSKAAAISNAQAQGKGRRHAMGEKAAATRESSDRKPMPKKGEAQPTKSKFNKPENRGK
jgi:hypothetical protein